MVHGIVSLATLVAFAFPFLPSASAGEWIQINSDCDSGGVSGWSKYTRCWAKKKRNKDRDRRRDYYTLRMTISGNATSGNYLARLWVEPYPGAESPRMQWTGADPFAPDRTVTSSRDCRSTTWTIGAGVAGAVNVSFSSTTEECKHESFGPKLYSQDGHHAGIWYAPKGSRAPSGVVKKAVVMVAVRTRQGNQPNWATDRYGAWAYSTQESD